MLLAGERSGIEGLCSWTPKQEKKITASELKERLPDGFNDFITPSRINRGFVVNDFRPL